MGSTPATLALFDPDAVGILDFPAVIESASAQVASQLLITPYFGFAAAVICEVEDKDILCEVQQLLIEDPVDFGQSFSSGLWTVPEVVNYLNQRQDDFLKRTNILYRRERMSYNPATHSADLPQDLIVLRRLVWIDENPDARTYLPVLRGDTWDLDNGIPSWEYEEKPHFPAVYSDTEAQQLTIKVGPGTLKKGVLEALYVPRGPRLSNTGVCLSVPDAFAPAIRWGLVADMLNKVGRAQDPVRGAYAESRYQEGVAAAELMLSGWA